VRRPLGLTVALLVLAVGGIVLGLRVAGPATYETPLGDVRVEVEPGLDGQVDAYVPLADWGVRARAFEGPLILRGEIRSIKREAVLRAATGEGAIIEDTRASLDDVAADALLRGVLFALGGAAILGLVGALALAATGHRRLRSLVGVVAGTVVASGLIIGGSALVVRATFNAEAFRDPSFYARGAELLQLLEAANKTEARAERYQATAENGVRSFSQLLAEGGVGQTGGFIGEAEGATTAILASDLHNNTLAVSSLEALGDRDEPVFFVGDFGHQGSEGEARLVAPRLAKLGPRVIAVSGNHDSALLMRRLVRAGLTVLTGSGRLRRDGTTSGEPIIEVNGMKVAGVADPLEWQGDRPTDPERIFSFSERPDGDREFEAAAQRIVRWFDALPERPDIVLIHNDGLAGEFGKALLERGPQPDLVVLTGHDHKQRIDRYGNVVVVNAGTVGAGGVLGLGSQKVGLGEIRFDAAGALQAVDLIQAEPLSGGAQAERVIVAGRECDDPAKECKLSD
jgi:predicted phosphodiesterase